MDIELAFKIQDELDALVRDYGRENIQKVWDMCTPKPLETDSRVSVCMKIIDFAKGIENE